ncbi:hypothetical protein DXG03_003253 [Asterophora parasitica]|uniref:F-box domain-containing protein n=1 Tax=Asterophora parasitica TaxID=117018 RepID=A0A9P7GD39_9AGAR|nr:hypothetical protein DXG03_003253 [Asterophora parasitica]
MPQETFSGVTATPTKRIGRDCLTFPNPAGDNDSGSALEVQKNRISSPSSTLPYLPAEVLVYIFSFHADEEINSSLVSTLWNVSQVCRSWRDASLGNARLWTYLSINAKDLPDWQLILQRMAGLWFTNAKSLPISFSLKCDQLHRNYVKVFSSGALDSLFPFLPHLSELQLVAVDIDILTTFFQLPRGTLSSLESLHVVTWAFELEKITSTEVFCSVPLLRRAILTVGRPTKYRLAADFIFPWGQLTHLQLKNHGAIDPIAWFAVFSQCSQLQHGIFRLGRNHVELDPFPAIPHVTFACLETLTLECDSSLGRLEMFSFPTLRNITIIGTDDKPMDKFLESFSPHLLHSLILVKADFSITAFLQFLGGCDILETLCIESPWFEVFHPLRHGRSAVPPPLLPNLKLFEVCILASERIYFSNDEENWEFMRPDKLAALLRWWYESPSPSLRRASLYYVYGYYHGSGRYRLEADSHEAQIERSLAFISGLVSLLQDYLFDETIRPSGLVLTTTVLHEYHDQYRQRHPLTYSRMNAFQ